jgi:hypothetical protein
MAGETSLRSLIRSTFHLLENPSCSGLRLSLLRRSSPEGSDGLIAESGSVVVGLGEVSQEEADEAGVGVDQEDASSDQRGIDCVAEDAPSTVVVQVLEDTREEELHVQHIDIIIRLIIIIYFNLSNLIILLK